MELTVALYGFFVYPVGDAGRSCAAIAAPAVRDVPHRCDLMLTGDVLASTAGVPPGPAAGMEVPLNGDVIGFGGQGAAAAFDFRLVPDFATLHCGARLDPDWLTTKRGALDGAMVLNGGTLTAFADPHTNVQKYEWDGCGRPVLAALTSLIVYELPDWSGRLTLEARDGATREITFTGRAATLALAHTPRVHHPDEVVDRAHAHATLALCAHHGPGPLQLGRHRSVKSNERDKALPAPLKRFLFRAALPPAGPIVITAKGRPNCGARLMTIA